MIFQELKMEKSIQKVLTEKSLTWRFLPNIIHRKKLYYSGVLTASTVQPISERFHKSNSREPITFTPKATLFTCYDIANSDEKLMIINIHGINFVSLRHFRNQIHEIVEHGLKHKGPIIFSGDFNTWNKNRVKFLEKILKRKLDLIPIFFEKKHSKKIKNFIFSPPLDHIFYSHKTLKLVKNSSQVLRQYKSSDHKPIFAEFQLREKMDDFEDFPDKNLAEA
jgi:endonuclease/exonuclease/phosphatase (EEP) superfamily protein YafD